MHRLRRSRWLPWALLAAFSLLTAVAGGAPLVRPVQAFERLCSANGSGRLVLPGFDAPAQPGAAHGADCALCVPASALPPAAREVPVVRARFATPPERVAPPWRIAKRSGPPPARAPPQV
ncbi:MAG: hypothetical protein ACTS5V_04020 [Giesbergeria sp.]